MLLVQFFFLPSTNIQFIELLTQQKKMKGNSVGLFKLKPHDHQIFDNFSTTFIIIGSQKGRSFNSEVGL